MTTATPPAPPRSTEGDARLVAWALQRWFRRHAGTQTGDDLCQVAHMALWRARERFDPALGTWSTFAAQAMRAAMGNELVRMGLARPASDKRPAVLTLDQVLDPIDRRALDPADAAEDAERSEALRDAIAALPEGLRRAVELRRQGLTRAAVGEALGITGQAVSDRQEKACAALAGNRRLAELAG